MAGGAVAIVMIAGFLPDVTEENWYQTNQYCKGVWQGTVGGAQGWGVEGLVVCWGGGCGGGQEKSRKIDAAPLLSRGGGAEFPTILGDSGFSRCTLHFFPLIGRHEFSVPCLSSAQTCRMYPFTGNGADTGFL